VTDWDGMLDKATRDELCEILVQNDFDTDAAFQTLLLDIPPGFRANLPIQGIHNGKMRINRALNSMNKVVSLKGGQRPLKIFLESALGYVQRSGHLRRLEAILAGVEAAGYPTAPPVPARTARSGLTATAAAPGENLRAALPAAGTMNPAAIEREALIAGLNETLPIRFLEGGLAAARSVFKIVVHSHLDGEAMFGADDNPLRSSGTAWMIAPGLAITNDHVFNARHDRDPPASDIDYGLQVQTAWLIADFHDPDAEPEGNLLPANALAARDRDLDFAIFRVPDSLSTRPPLRLRRYAVRKQPRQALGTRVNLLQHPNGGIMKLGFRNNFVVVGDNKILAYLTDTAFGSSGSPVMDDNWNVAALHAGSEDIGDMEITLQGNRVKRRNFGVPIPRVRQHLEQADPMLHNKIFGAGGP